MREGAGRAVLSRHWTEGRPPVHRPERRIALRSGDEGRHWSIGTRKNGRRPLVAAGRVLERAEKVAACRRVVIEEGNEVVRVHEAMRWWLRITGNLCRDGQRKVIKPAAEAPPLESGRSASSAAVGCYAPTTVAFPTVARRISSFTFGISSTTSRKALLWAFSTTTATSNAGRFC